VSADLVSERMAALLAAPREHDGVRVVTLSDIARVHGKPVETVKRAWRRRRDKFEAGEDYVMVPAQGRRNAPPLKNGPESVALTESGYALLSKVFDDDVSWEIQRKLTRSYFRVRDAVRSIPGDAVLVSRAELERSRSAMLDLATECHRLAQALDREASAHARGLGAWRHLGPGVKALAREPGGIQARIKGVDHVAVLADLAAGSKPDAKIAALANVLARVALAGGVS
jgi:hypothetical protein